MPQMPLSGGFEWMTTAFFLVAWYGAAAAYAASAYLPPRGALAVLLGGLLLIGLLLSAVGVATLWALHRTALPLFYLTGPARRHHIHAASKFVPVSLSQFCSSCMPQRQSAHARLGCMGPDDAGTGSGRQAGSRPSALPCIALLSHICSAGCALLQQLWVIIGHVLGL